MILVSRADIKGRKRRAHLLHLPVRPGGDALTDSPPWDAGLWPFPLSAFRPDFARQRATRRGGCMRCAALLGRASLSLHGRAAAQGLHSLYGDRPSTIALIRHLRLRQMQFEAAVAEVGAGLVWLDLLRQC